MGVEKSAGADHDGQERDPKNANKNAAEAETEHMRANPLMYKSVSADLVIMGDPKLKPFTTVSRLVTIMFINPFHHVATTVMTDDDCGHWLADPVCNEILSNRGWMVESVTHRIENGNYTTTLHITLPMPGIDLNMGGFAGADRKGWRPPTQC